MIHPVCAAEQVLNQFTDRFISEMDAKDIVYDLEKSDIISDGDLKDVMKESDEKLRNKILHFRLKAKCTKEALVTVCEKIIAVKGNQKMKKLGKDMRNSMFEGRYYTMSYTCVHVNQFMCMDACVCMPYNLVVFLPDSSATARQSELCAHNLQTFEMLVIISIALQQAPKAILHPTSLL